MPITQGVNSGVTWREGLIFWGSQFLFSVVFVCLLMAGPLTLTTGNPRGPPRRLHNWYHLYIILYYHWRNHSWMFFLNLSYEMLFTIMDVMCCVAIVFPVACSIKHLKEASKKDGKGAVQQAFLLSKYDRRKIVSFNTGNCTINLVDIGHCAKISWYLIRVQTLK